MDERSLFGGYYSDTAQLHRPESGLARESIPERLRNAMANKIEPNPILCSSRAWAFAIQELDWDMRSFTQPKPNRSYEHQCNKDAILNAVRQSSYSDWLDLVMALYKFARSLNTEVAEDFRGYLNDRFIRYYSAYVMAPDGSIREAGTHVGERTVAEARAILMAPELRGPDSQFQEAILSLQRRPHPSPSGAISNAMNAVEGVVRIALGDAQVKLGPGAKHLLDKHGVASSVSASLANLYGYASQEGGRHGLVDEPTADPAVAEYVVHQAAAAIVFVARLEGWATVDSSSLQAVPTSAEPVLVAG